MFLIILLYYFYVAITDTSKNFNKVQKGIFILIYTLTVLFVTSVMYVTFNIVGSEMIGGVQARYMYPALPILLIAISNNNLVKKDEGKDNSKNVMVGQLAIIFISVVQTII